ncbi:MAG TPA: oligosaccharide flippase family protein [Polyangia bacterium]
MTPIARLRELGRTALGESSPLVASRLASAALTFALPLVLVRLLDPDAFGTYKQFFLVGQTLLLVGQVGLTQSLYYFLPRGGEERGAYVTHTLVVLSLLGAVLGLAIYLGAPAFGGKMGIGELEPLRLPLALYAALMLAAAPLEGALTSEGKIGGAAIAYVVTDAVRASALILAAKLVGEVAIFWAAVGVAALRAGALALLVARRTLPASRPHRKLWRKQLAFALPFAGAIWLYVGQRYFAQYAVAARFDAATFALYAVAAFHLPVVDIVFTPISEVLMVHLGKTLGKADGLAAWDDAVEKLASLLLPAACGAWLLGGDVLPLLFTHKYDAAVPLFFLTTFEIPLAVVPVDALLRAAGDTRFLFGFNAVRVAMTAAGVLSGIHFWGLRGAIVGSLVSEALARLVMLARGRRFLLPRGGKLSAMLDGAALFRVALASALACVPAWAVKRAFAAPVESVLLSALTYGAFYLGLRQLLKPRARLHPADLAA